jgi:hypothetical protein
MNLYFCTDDSHDSGLYVAAESRGKAKCMYCDYCDSLLDFIMVHTYIMRRDFEAPAGVYDENCEALEAAGVRYCEED